MDIRVTMTATYKVENDRTPVDVVNEIQEMVEWQRIPGAELNTVTTKWEIAT